MNKVYCMLENYIPIPTALKTKKNDEFLIISNQKFDIYYFNDMAKELWLSLDGKLSIKDIFAKFIAEYDVDEDVLKEDIVNFIRDLQWKDLIRLKRE